MDTRKIQKSGSTHYVYLPATWCRNHSITTDSVVSLEKSSNGNLLIHPNEKAKQASSLKIDLTEKSQEVINKVIIATYINPIKNFEITLPKNLSANQILEHKKLLGGLELVDFEDNKIICQTTFSMRDPDLMLSNMIRKIKSIITLIKQGEIKELIDRYEEEIDKSNLIIHKATISTFMYKRESKLRHIELFYISLISRTLEQLTDDIILLDKTDTFLTDIHEFIVKLEDIHSNVEQDKVIAFIKDVAKYETVKVTNPKTYLRQRIISHLDHLAEILSDWFITNKIDEAQIEKKT
ncbi:MAG: hypothetical protein V1859_08750 [archaeon]